MTALLVLRPEPGAAATARAAAARGLTATIAPLFSIVPVAWGATDPERHDALMLTSANAVRHAGAALDSYRRLPVFAVGDATALAAREAGLDVAFSGTGDAAALVAEMQRRGIAAPLHLAGSAHRAIEQAGVKITRAIVYRADPVTILPAAARSTLGEGAVALLHSPAAAVLFSRLVDAAGLRRDRLRAATISETATAAIGLGWEHVATAAAPNDAALLAAAAALCEERRETKRGRA